MKYFRKDIIKVQVVGSLYKHRLLHGKMKIIVILICTSAQLFLLHSCADVQIGITIRIQALRDVFIQNLH